MDFDKYYEKALRFLSFRPRSEKEVKDNLAKKKASPTIINMIIQKLRDQKFLNDKEFTKWWIEQRTIVKPTGIRIIKIELQRKGIDKEAIDEVLERSKDTVHNELDMARDLVQRRFKRYQGLERQEIYQKLGGFLSRRGFDYDTIKKAIDEVLQK